MPWVNVQTMKPVPTVGADFLLNALDDQGLPKQDTYTYKSVDNEVCLRFITVNIKDHPTWCIELRAHNNNTGELIGMTTILPVLTVRAIQDAIVGLLCPALNAGGM